MSRAAGSRVQVPRLGAEDPFRPDLYARVQNVKSNLSGSGFSASWRGRGGWGTSASHQRVTVKIRYRGDAAGAGAYADYMVKHTKGIDGQAPEAWDKESSGFDAPARVRQWMREGDDRWFKLVFSPENKFGGIEGMVTHSMTEAEVHLGTKLQWFAVRHHDSVRKGGKDHVHVFLRGRDDQGNTLSIDRRYIRFGFRDSAQRYVTYHPRHGLGERSEQEIAAGRERAAQIRERRDQVRALVFEAKSEGVVDRREQQRLVSDIRTASPSYLNQIGEMMQSRIDGAENVWRERTRGRAAESLDTGFVRDEARTKRVEVTQDSVRQRVDVAERAGVLDALDADRYRAMLNRGALEEVNRSVEDAMKAKTGAGRNVGQSQDSERIKRKGGLSL